MSAQPCGPQFCNPKGKKVWFTFLQPGKPARDPYTTPQREAPFFNGNTAPEKKSALRGISRVLNSFRFFPFFFFFFFFFFSQKKWATCFLGCCFHWGDVL